MAVRALAVFTVRRLDWYFVLYTVVVVTALLLGGGTHPGFLGDVIIQLVSILLLLVALSRLVSTPDLRFPWTDVALWLAIVLVPLVQLVPVAPSVWLHFPDAALRREAFQLTGHELEWRPISLVPESTVLSMLSLVTPAAVFFGGRLLSPSQRRTTLAAVLVVATISVFLGLAQVAGGPDSSLRFYAVTNTIDAVGFFANRNHYAALLYVCIVITGMLAFDAGMEIFLTRSRLNRDPKRLIVFGVYLTLAFLLAVAQIITRSRAGILLTALGLIGVAILGSIDPRNKWRKGSLAVMAVLGILVVIFAFQFGYSRFADRMTFAAIRETRVTTAKNSTEAVERFFPTGSGIGTFKYVYSTIEKPDDLIFYTFVNEAHDDYIQVIEEAGVLGGLVLLMCFAWLGTRVFEISPRSPARATAIDTTVKRATALSILLLLLHSMVDYPLRTSALMSLMAVFCAFQAAPLIESGAANSNGRQPRKSQAPQVGQSPRRKSPKAIIRSD